MSPFALVVAAGTVVTAVAASGCAARTPPPSPPAKEAKPAAAALPTKTLRLRWSCHIGRGEVDAAQKMSNPTVHSLCGYFPVDARGETRTRRLGDELVFVVESEPPGPAELEVTVPR